MVEYFFLSGFTGLVSEYVLREIMRRIAGDIVVSDDPGGSLKRWRLEFGFTQQMIARMLGVKPSVVSDYENGKRTPGSRIVRRYVEALIELDGKRGWRVVRRLSRSIGLPSEAIADLREFSEPLSVEDILYIVKGVALTASFDATRRVFGYTIVDSIRGILTLSGMEFYYLLGMTSERVVVFTNVTIGRSPMIAVRVSPVKPSVIVIHGPRSRVDPLALKLAELERIPFILSLARDLDELKSRLASAAGS